MTLPEHFGHKLVVALLMLLMIMPLLATLLYSLADSWSAGILPDQLTLKWYFRLFSDERFLQAMANSLVICFAALLLTLVLVIPALFVVYCYFPGLKPVMNLLILAPFAIPPIVSSVGLLQLFSSEPLILTGTPWILIGAWFTVALPFMYRAAANSIAGLDLQDLLDAAHLLGASTARVFFSILLPNLRKGLNVSVFLCFSLLFGEFVYASILSGSQYETVQVYLFNKRYESGHFASAIVISYFIIIMLMTLMAIKWGEHR